MIGIDVSGCRHRCSASDPPSKSVVHKRNWVPRPCHLPGFFAAGKSVVLPVPPHEWVDAARWPVMFPAIAPRVPVPVRITFAEYESWWRHADLAIADLVSRFTASPRAVVDRLRNSGHNISHGWAARTSHLTVFGFLEEYLPAGRSAA